MRNRVLLSAGAIALLATSCAQPEPQVLSEAPRSVSTADVTSPDQTTEEESQPGRFIARCATEADGGTPGTTYFTDGSQNVTDHCLSRYYIGVQPAPGALYVPDADAGSLAPSRENTTSESPDAPQWTPAQPRTDADPRDPSGEDGERPADDQPTTEPGEPGSTDPDDDETDSPSTSPGETSPTSPTTPTDPTTPGTTEPGLEAPGTGTPGETPSTSPGSSDPSPPTEVPSTAIGVPEEGPATPPTSVDSSGSLGTFSSGASSTSQPTATPRGPRWTGPPLQGFGPRN